MPHCEGRISVAIKFMKFVYLSLGHFWKWRTKEEKSKNTTGDRGKKEVLTSQRFHRQEERGGKKQEQRWNREKKAGKATKISWEEVSVIFLTVLLMP